MKNLACLIFISLMITSCGFRKDAAPIIYNHKNSNLISTGVSNDAPLLIGEDSAKKGGVNYQTEEIIRPADYNDNDYIIPEQSPIEADKRIIYHEVQPGETIEDIALQYEQTVEEIGRVNELMPPYFVEPYQSLKIIVDGDYKAKPQVKKQADNRHKLQPKKADFIKPVSGNVLTKFGQSTAIGKNKGVNISASSGAKILASATGKVIYADYDATFGNLVMIKIDGKNIITAYAHLEDLIVNKGSRINQGDIIGYVGETGKVKKPQLHFAIREGKTAVDPNKYVQF